MNKFEKQLEKWNNGILRGAQAKLAKTLGVSTATTAQWSTGKRHPSKGYVSQMAALFHMDVYGVLKLFEPRSTTYPEPTLHRQTKTLCDKNTTDCSYNATQETPAEESPEQSNSVLLPFLARIPAAFPQYDECDVIEWWSVPRRYARGAKYIIRSIDAGLELAQDEDDLCFVKPSIELQEGALMLFRTPDGKNISCCIKNGKPEISDINNLVPLGLFTRRIHGL